MAVGKMDFTNVLGEIRGIVVKETRFVTRPELEAIEESLEKMFMERMVED